MPNVPLWFQILFNTSVMTYQPGSTHVIFLDVPGLSNLQQPDLRVVLKECTQGFEFINQISVCETLLLECPEGE
jgi:hypothetical protein